MNCVKTTEFGQQSLKFTFFIIICYLYSLDLTVENLKALDEEDIDADDDPEGDDAEEDSRRVHDLSTPGKSRISIPRYFSFFKSEHVTERGGRTSEGVETGAVPNQTADMWRDANEFISTGTNTLGWGMSHVASTVVGATSNVVGGATDLVVGVAAITPGLKSLVLPQVHW